MADPKIKYDIEAAVKGEADAEALAKTLRGVGDVLEGDLQQGALAAAQALEALGSKQRTLESFRALTNETGSLAVELAQAETALRQVDAQLSQASAATQRFAQAELQSKAALESKRADLTAAKKAYEDLQAGTVGAARRTDEYRQSTQAAQANIQQLSAEIKQHSRSLKEAEGNTRTAQQAENALSAQHQQTSAALVQARGALDGNNAALSAGRDNLRAMSIEAANLAQAERNLQGAVVQVRQEVAAMAPAYQQAAAASSQSTQVQAQNQRTLREGMTSISTQLQRIQQIATVALGGSYAGGLAKSVADTADEFKNLEARVKLATGEGPQFQAAFAGVTKVALDTNSALDETGTLFARLAKAGKDAGQSAQVAQENALGLTRTINQAIQLSGGSADAAKAAITQLIQGLQSGVLRGEEFNSVMEQAPRLAQALANGLGVTTEQLRKMAEQGALTADTVMKSLQGQADVVAGEFGKLPPTVGRALQNLTTQWTLYIGESDKGLISSTNAAKVIDALGKNLDVVVGTLTAAGKAWAAIKIAGLVADFARWATNMLTATAALEANTVAATRNTVAQQANSAAQVQGAAAQGANTAATNANTVARAGNAKAWAEMGAFTRAAGAAQEAATAATVRNTAAVAANATKVASAGLVWRGASALFGPWGIAVAALAPEIVGLTRSLGEQIAKLAGWGKVMEQAEQKLRQQDAALKEHSASLARQNALYEEARNKTFELTKEAAGLISQFDKLRKDGDSVAESIGKIGKDFDLSNIPGIKNASAVLDKLLADGKLTASEFESAWSQALNGKDLAQFEVMARAAFSGAAREGERLTQVMDASVREAVKRTGLDFDSLQGKIGATSRSALNDLDALVGGLDKLKAQGVDTGRVLEASLSKAIDTADGQKAIDEVRARVDQLRKQLGDKVADGLLDQAKQKAEELGDALDKAKPGINSVAEAMKALGITSDESLRKTAATAKEAYEAMTASGTRSARELGEGFKKAAEAAIAANNGIAPSWVEAQAAARGYTLEVDTAGKTTLKSMADAKGAIGAVTAAVRDASAELKQMGIDADTASQKVKDLAAGGQALAAGFQSRKEKRDQAVDDSSIAKRGNTSAQDLVPTFNTKAEAEAWKQKWTEQYFKENSNVFRTGGMLGTYMKDLTMFEYNAEMKALEIRDAMKEANGGKSPASTNTSPTPGTTTGYTVNIVVEGVNRSINTDAAGASSLQELIRQLTTGRSTSR